MSAFLHRLHEHIARVIGLGGLAAACLALSGIALPMSVLLPTPLGRRLGRQGISISLRCYLWGLSTFCGCRFDLRDLDKLRGAGPMVLTPNHPGLLDALMIMSRLPETVVVLKAELIDSLFFGALARLAGYIRNDWFIGLVKMASKELGRGSQLLMFPEGTRTTRDPVNVFKAGPAVIAARAKVPVQALIIEVDTPFLGKNWPLFRRPELPMSFRITLGQRFDPPKDSEAFTTQLQSYFEQELRARRAGASARSGS